MKSKIDYTLYLVTDRNLMSTQTLEEAVESSIKGGCTVVQLREKDCTSFEFFNIALNIKKITDKYNIPLIINDRIDIALAVDASGVHIGQEDIPVLRARKIIGNDKILGVSASTLQQALKAQSDGADYLGVGAMYLTNTKRDAENVSFDELKLIIEKVNIPLVVIGGINKNTIPNFYHTGIDGIAVVSAVISNNNIENAAKELKEMTKYIKD